MQIKARFDDISPSTNFDDLERFLKKFNKDIGLIIGVVPICLDPKLSNKSAYSKESINKIKKLSKLENVYIFQHGTNHIISKNNIGAIKSEFTFEDFKVQKEKIKEGLFRLLKYDIYPVGFMPPFHGYDLNTLKAAKEMGFKLFCTIDEDIELNGIENIVTRINFATNIFIADLLSDRNIFCYHIEQDDIRKASLDIEKINIAHKLNLFERLLGNSSKDHFSQIFNYFLDNFKYYFNYNLKRICIKTLFQKFYNYRSYCPGDELNKKNHFTVIVRPKTLKLSSRTISKLENLKQKAKKTLMPTFFGYLFFENRIKAIGFFRLGILINLICLKGYFKGFCIDNNKVIAFIVKGSNIDRLLYIFTTKKNKATDELTLLIYYSICNIAFTENKMIDLGGISTPLIENMNDIDKLKSIFGGLICTYQIKNNSLVK